MIEREDWLDWAIELQALAQTGAHYTRDVFDLERYARIREIAADMLAHASELPIERVRDLFLNETGYQTPKLDTRAAIIEDGRVLLVQERDGRWALPGGWVDVNVSVAENAVKEVLEETGITAECVRLVAMQKHEKHHPGRTAWGICTALVLCRRLRETLINSVATLPVPFPPSAACRSLDLPLVSLRNLQLQLTKNSLGIVPPHLISASLAAASGRIRRRSLRPCSRRTCFRSWR